MLVVIVAKESCRPVLVGACRTEVGKGKGRLRIALAGMVEHTVPVGWGVDIWEGAAGSCPEHNSLDALDRGKEHTLPGLLAIDVNLYHTF